MAVERLRPCLRCGKSRPIDRNRYCSTECAKEARIEKNKTKPKGKRTDPNSLGALHFRTAAACRRYWNLDQEKEPAPYIARTLAEAEALEKEGL